MSTTPALTIPLVTSLCAAKTYLQIPASDTTRDAVINQLIPQISKRIQKYCGRRFGTSEYTHYFSGSGTPCLVLKERPVQVNGLRVWVDDNGFWDQGTPPDGPFPASSELEAGTFALDIDDDGLGGSGLLYRTNGVWPQARAALWQNQSPDLAADWTFPSGNIKVLYTAGELPEDITLAANISIAATLQKNIHGGQIISEAYEDYSYTLAGPVMKSGLVAVFPPEALEILASYRELVW